MTLAAFKLVEFFAYTDAFKSVTPLSQSMTKQLDLNNIGFNFAVENLGEQFAQIKLHQVTWQSASATEPSLTEIAMVDCASVLGVDLGATSLLRKTRTGAAEDKKYLCPSWD